MRFLCVTTTPEEVQASIPKTFLETFSPKFYLEPDTKTSEFEAHEFHCGAGYVRYSLSGVLPNAYLIPACHSAIVAPVDNSVEKSDGAFLFFEEKDVTHPIALKTADCLAVSICGEQEGLRFGTLFHAGWRGFTGGIQANAIDALEKEFAIRRPGSKLDRTRLHVQVSPAIFGCTYQCGSDVKEALEAHTEKHFSETWRKSVVVKDCIDVSRSVSTTGTLHQSEKIYPDLQLLLCIELIGHGFNPVNFTVVRENTFGHPFLYSYRFACLYGGDTKKRMVSHLFL